jgi:hypothetical protein
MKPAHGSPLLGVKKRPGRAEHQADDSLPRTIRARCGLQEEGEVKGSRLIAGEPNPKLSVSLRPGERVHAGEGARRGGCFRRDFTGLPARSRGMERRPGGAR